MSDATKKPDPTAEDPRPTKPRAVTRPGVPSHAADVAVRPGFRNPPSPKTAARQKPKKGKR